MTMCVGWCAKPGYSSMCPSLNLLVLTSLLPWCEVISPRQPWHVYLAGMDNLEDAKSVSEKRICLA